MNGYTGKILRINLTERKLSIIDTRKYEPWVGGHGIGSALFWDLVEDKAISGFDPRNVVTIMTSPLTGTLTPGAAGRTEVQGIGVQSYPIEWFTRGNFGGRFGAMLKFAGWDGIAIEGKADRPVWIDIRDSDVRFKDASSLWGMDTWKTQEMIWNEVSGKSDFTDWLETGGGQAGGRTTQRPAILTIGQAGENLSRLGSIIHDAGNAVGQGGFGGVWGSKNLKAISVIGSGSIEIADPNALIEARLWSQRQYGMNLDDPRPLPKETEESGMAFGFGSPSLPVVFWKKPKQLRPQACIGCHSACRARHAGGLGNESSCMETLFYVNYDLRQHSGFMIKAVNTALDFIGQEGLAFLLLNKYGNQTSSTYEAADLVQKYGINAFEMGGGLQYLRDLYKMGVLGPGKQIDCDLPFDRLGEQDFIEKLLEMIAFRKGIGDDIAEGFFRAAKKWGRLEQDTATGLLQFPHWGLPNHYEPRSELEWGYGSILSDRDVNEHDFNLLFWMPSSAKWARKDPPISAEEVVKIFSEKLTPFQNDPLMLDFSTENMYSEHIAKLVAWHRHYTRFWKQSVLYCDFLFSDFLNPNRADGRGLTGEGEQKFLNAVTGKDYEFLDGMELGKKIWNLDNAIWSLQGRHRDMVHFADYVYKVPTEGFMSLGYYMPGRKNGKWDYIPVHDRFIDKAKFEEWKTRFYTLEGWDPATGWPVRKNLESIGLKYVADELGKKGKLGKG
jgi:aldehyde:ferredoxin oxidoreductase